MNPPHFTVLTITPEAAAERRIYALGAVVANAGLLFRSAAILSGSPQILDLLYPVPGASPRERTEKLPAAFLSYAEYASPTALVLLESPNAAAIPAHAALQELKGPSLPSADGRRTLRGRSPSTMRAYSYVHVPDEEAVAPLITYAFPLEKSLAEVPGDGGSWSTLQEVLTMFAPRETPCAALRILVNRCVGILRLSRLSLVLDCIPDTGTGAGSVCPDVVWPSGIAALLAPLRRELERFRHELPQDCYAARRLAAAAGAAIWLSYPQCWDVGGLVELPALLAYAGVPATETELQLVRAWIAYGPSGDRIPMRRPA